MLNQERQIPRYFLDKFDRPSGGSNRDSSEFEFKNAKFNRRDLFKNYESDSDITNEISQSAQHQSLVANNYKIEPQLKNIIKVSVTSPTFSGWLGHALYQSVNAPLMLPVQTFFSGLSLFNELRAKINFKFSQNSTEKNHQSDGTFKGFALDIIKSPAVQRVFEGVFYGSGALLVAPYNLYLASIFATGAIASLASGYYMNKEVNYWQDKAIPKLVQNFFDMSDKSPKFLTRLFSNPGFWACIADGLISFQRLIEKNQLAVLGGINIISVCCVVGICCFATGIFQASKLAVTGREEHKYFFEDKSIATVIAGAGNFSFGLANILLQNYAVGGALVLWSIQSFLMASKIDSVVKKNS